PSRYTSPSVTSYLGWPITAEARVLLPVPLGPMTACTSPPFRARSTPVRISLPSTDTFSPRISNNADMFFPPLVGALVHPLIKTGFAPAGATPGHRRNPASHLV